MKYLIHVHDIRCVASCWYEGVSKADPPGLLLCFHCLQDYYALSFTEAVIYDGVYSCFRNEEMAILMQTCQQTVQEVWVLPKSLFDQWAFILCKNLVISVCLCFTWFIILCAQKLDQRSCMNKIRSICIQDNNLHRQVIIRGERDLKISVIVL